jgi:hypothetical protein
MLFLQTFMNNLFVTKSSCLLRHAIECTVLIFIFSCVWNTETYPLPYPPEPPLPPTATAKLASVWLCVGLELSSFSY